MKIHVAPSKRITKEQSKKFFWKNPYIQTHYLTLCLLLAVIRLGQTQAPLSQRTFQPMFIEAGVSHLCCPPSYGLSQNFALTNLNGGATLGSYFGHFPVTLQRIHKINPPSYKLVLSIIGIQADVIAQSYSLTSNIELSQNSKNSTAFIVRVDIERIEKMVYLKFNSLVISAYAYSDFIIDPFVENTARSIDFQTYTINGAYSSSSPSSMRFFILNGIDIVMKTGQTYIVWTTLFTHIDSATFQLSLTGQRAVLNKMKYTILSINNLIRAFSGPSKYYLKIFQDDKTCNVNSNGCGCQLRMIVTLNGVSTHLVFPNNYFFGVYDFGSTGKFHFMTIFVPHITPVGNGQINFCLQNNNGMRAKGFVFWGHYCPDGYYLEEYGLYCKPCQLNQVNCIKCLYMKCLQCAQGYELSSDQSNCEYLTPAPQGCLAKKPLNGALLCLLCDISLRRVLQSNLNLCQCQTGYLIDSQSGLCKQICGDGIAYQDQCDDANAINNDGCDSNCKLEPGPFSCDKTTIPTTCSSTEDLVYEVQDITKSQGVKFSGTIILRPRNKILPFSVVEQNFLNQDVHSHMSFKIILEQVPTQKVYEPDYKLQKVENNKIHITFNYDFTVENMKGRIFLDYSQSKYRDSVQTVIFVMKGSNSPLEYSDYGQFYESVSQGILVSTIMSMLGLLVGLFVPKFIGLETILTMQLIYYSQLLISKLDKWPVGFAYFNYLKVASGFSSVMRLTQYVPQDIVSQKYQKLQIQKTVVQNYNTSFLLVFLGFTAFCITSLIRVLKQSNIQRYQKESHNLDPQKNPQLKQMLKSYHLLRKVNESTYWLVSQLVVWSILPILSAIGAELLIENSSVLIFPGSFGDLMLSLRGPILGIVLGMIVVIWLNHIRNIFLSQLTIRKISQKPQQLLYKKLVVIYLFSQGTLLFFFNDIKIANIPIIPVIVLLLHCTYTITLVTIKPYKLSLRIHSIALYMNQILYLVDLIVINMLNLLPHVDEFIIIGLGYLIIGSIGILILLTVVRLYYEIRYGEGLEKRLKMEREKIKEQQEMRKQQKLVNQRKMLQIQAKHKLQDKQKARDMNSYLIQTQAKQMQKIQLLDWLQAKHWQQQEKQKYYYKHYHQKPLQWLKQNQPTEYQKKIQQIQQTKRIQQQKRKKLTSNPEFVQLTERMRMQHERKKRRDQREERKQSKSHNAKHRAPSE